MVLNLFSSLQKFNMIIAISGTPGTGKTVVSEKLAKKLGWKIISLNKLAEEKNLYAGFDKRRKCKIVDIKRLSKEVKRIKENVVIESHYAHEMPADFVIILRTEPKELKKRLEKRGWPKKKIEENIESEIMEVCKTEALEHRKRVYEIDTTGKKTERVVDEIIHFLRE